MARVLTLGLALVLAAVLAACALRSRQAPATDHLAAQLDCLREHHLGVVAAHRGQPDQAAPENVMSSFRASLAAGVPFLEIDVATTKDGVLVLMHDDTLDRTTTGSGQVRDRTWAELQPLRVKRPDGTVSDDRIPRFTDVLAWGRGVGARFELDVKRTTSVEAVIRAVTSEGMRSRVLVVTYTLDDARTVHRLDPRIAISVTMEHPEQLAAALTTIDPQRMLAWTGTREPETKPFGAARAAGIEPIFGTLGRPGQRLDDVYAADGNVSEYRDLVASGVVMIASDAAVVAQRAIGFGYRACFR